MFTLKNILILIVRNVIISLIVISIVVGGIIFISKKIEVLSSSASTKNRLESELQKAADTLQVYKNDNEIVGANYINIENAFAPTNNILGFINTLDNLLNDAKTIKQVYNFETPISSSISAPFPISTISYTNSFTANITTFSNYLKDFEKLPYFTNIENFTISSQDKTGWTGISTISFRAILYAKTIQ